MFEFELALGRVHLLYDLRVYSTPLYMSPPNKQAYIIECLDQNIQVYWWRRWKHHLPVFSLYGRWNYQSRNCEVIDETIPLSLFFCFWESWNGSRKVGRRLSLFLFNLEHSPGDKGGRIQAICMCVTVFLYLYVHICICVFVFVYHVFLLLFKI